jgi:hypothetical protein
MNAQNTKQFLQRYFEAVAADSDEGLKRYMADESLKEHGRFIQSAFPGYRIDSILDRRRRQ